MENPWHNILSQPSSSDITVAPWAHLSDSGAGFNLYVFSSLAKRLSSVTRLTPVPRTLD
jgi:hypothetical protein